MSWMGEGWDGDGGLTFEFEKIYRFGKESVVLEERRCVARGRA